MNQENYKEIAKIIKKEREYIDNDKQPIAKRAYALHANRYLALKFANYFEKKEKSNHWVYCENCSNKGIDSRIAIDKNTIFPLDCDCGNVIEGFNKKQFLKNCGIEK